ncbi:MAG: hypothetical protein V9G12_19825 [Microthrixaceae bacterium]
MGAALVGSASGTRQALAAKRASRTKVQISAASKGSDSHGDASWSDQPTRQVSEASPQHNARAATERARRPRAFVPVVMGVSSNVRYPEWGSPLFGAFERVL